MKVFKSLAAKWLIPPGFLDIYTHIASSRHGGKAYSDEEQRLLNDNHKLKDIHCGERCFIIGCGSSVKQQDLTKLAGESVITVSNAFVHPAVPLIRPKYHVLSPALAYHGDFNKLETFMAWFKDMEEKTFDAEMFFHIGDRKELINHGLYTNRVVHWVNYVPWDELTAPEIDLARIPDIWSVSETAITVALYMGFSEVYLLGFDHDWFNGLYVYFFDKDKEHKLQPDEKKIDFVDSEFQMRRHAYIFKKYKYLYSLKRNIYNANDDPNSYVDVFPKVKYEELFTKQ